MIAKEAIFVEHLSRVVRSVITEREKNGLKRYNLTPVQPPYDRFHDALALFRPQPGEEPVEEIVFFVPLSERSAGITEEDARTQLLCTRLPKRFRELNVSGKNSGSSVLSRAFLEYYLTTHNLPLIVLASATCGEPQQQAAALFCVIGVQPQDALTKIQENSNPINPS